MGCLDLASKSDLDSGIPKSRVKVKFSLGSDLKT